MSATDPKPSCACGAPLICCFACFLKKQGASLAKKYGPMAWAFVAPKVQEFLEGLPEAEGGLKK